MFQKILLLNHFLFHSSVLNISNGVNVFTLNGDRGGLPPLVTPLLKEVRKQRRRQNKSTHCAAAAFADVIASNNPKSKQQKSCRDFRVKAFTQ